jgi:hypothetical protein
LALCRLSLRLQIEKTDCYPERPLSSCCPI